MTQVEVNPKQKLRVLIADDIQETRRNTRLMLSMIENVEVVAIASDGEQAVRMTQEQRPEIVILDINMPKMDGLAAFRQIRQIDPTIGCIIISAEKSSDVLRTAMSIGIRDYLFKPFTVDQMEQALEKVSARLRQSLQENQQKQELIQKNEAYLKQLATEYVKTRRTDEQALEVYEHLASNPACELRWLRTLAMVM